MKLNIPTFPKWAERKPAIPVILSLFKAFSAGPIHTILKDPDAYYKRHNLSKLPSIKEWLGYYEMEDFELDWLINWLEEELDNPASLYLITTILKFILRGTSLLRKDPKRFEPIIVKEDVIRFADWLDGIDLDELKKIIDNLPNSKRKNKYDDHPMTVFGIRVWIPCFYYYGEIPYNLFKEVTEGNFESLCKLIQIDKAILNNDEISEMFQKLSLNYESKEYQTFLRAFNAPFKRSKSEKQTKERYAAIISESSKSFGCQLNARQIQDLFDMVAKAKDPEALQDLDIGTPESFAKQIQRKSPIFSRLFNLDKK